MTSIQLRSKNTKKIMKYKILIVDDQPINIQAAYAILADQYEVYMAVNGQNAIDLCQTVAIDLFLIDLHMPMMSGITLCQILKNNEKTKNVPIVFMTASQSLDDESLCWDEGGSDFVTKPINPKTLIKRISYHLMMKEHTQSLIKLSILDGLTNLHNRRYFDEQLEKIWRDFIRSRSSLSLILIDVDYFKLYNDNYGHLAGDNCLKKISVALKKSLHRPLDISARFGGDEFVCILPETDDIGAMHVAQRIEKAVQKLKLPHAYSTICNHVTLSIGVVSVSKDDDSDTHLQESRHMLEWADKALYQAKMDGRAKIRFNRMKVYCNPKNNRTPSTKKSK